jgi:CBS domain-containing protein
MRPPPGPRAAAAGRRPRRDPREAAVSKVRDVMTAEPIVLQRDQSIADAAVRRLPVMAGGRIVGMVSIGDLALTQDDASALADISAARPNQ